MRPLLGEGCSNHIKDLTLQEPQTTDPTNWGAHALSAMPLYSMRRSRPEILDAFERLYYIGKGGAPRHSSSLAMWTLFQIECGVGAFSYFQHLVLNQKCLRLTPCENFISCSIG